MIASEMYHPSKLGQAFYTLPPPRTSTKGRGWVLNQEPAHCCTDLHTLNSAAMGPFSRGAPGSGDLELRFGVALMARYMNPSQIVGNFRVILLTGLLQI